MLARHRIGTNAWRKLETSLVKPPWLQSPIFIWAHMKNQFSNRGDEAMGTPTTEGGW